MTSADEVALAGDGGLDHAAAGGRLDARLLELRLDAGGLLLHLHDHPLHVRHAHGCWSSARVWGRWVDVVDRGAPSLADASRPCGRRGHAAGQLTSPTSAMSSAKIRWASARMCAASASSGSGGSRSRLLTTQRMPTGWPRKPAIPSSMPGALALGGLAEEVLLLGEAERDDVALDADRPAGLDERLEGRALADHGDDRRASRGGVARGRRRAAPDSRAGWRAAPRARRRRRARVPPGSGGGGRRLRAPGRRPCP